MFLSVRQDVHAKVSALSYPTKSSRCHVRLNAPVQGLRQHLSSPVMVDTVPAYASPYFPGQSPDGLSSTKGDGDIHYQFVFSCITLSLSILAWTEGVNNGGDFFHLQLDGALAKSSRIFRRCRLSRGSKDLAAGFNSRSLS